MLLNDIFFFSGKPISWALLNPSVSPFKVSANGMVVESSNPAVRLYRYNTFTGEVCLFLYTIYFMCTLFQRKTFEPKHSSEIESLCLTKLQNLKY